MKASGNSKVPVQGKRFEVQGPGFQAQNPQAQAGFTLLEVMIALAIVAIALVTLLGLGNRSIDINGRLQHITRATLLAQQKMTEIETQGSGVQEAEGPFDPPHEIYRWRIALEETPLPSVRMVTVTVFWGEERHNDLVDLASLIEN